MAIGLWRGGNSPLNPLALGVDTRQQMSISGNHRNPLAEPETHGEVSIVSQAESGRWLAHEMANLLDGGLRQIGLVVAALKDGADRGADGDDHGGGSVGRGELLMRLNATHQAMNMMALLLRRWMAHPASPPDTHSRVVGTLGRAVDHVVGMLSPITAAHRVRVSVAFSDDDVARLPVGPLYPVIANALRNSIEAMIGSDPARDQSADADRRHVGLAARVHQDRVWVEVRDTGPGLDPAVTDDRGCLRIGRTTKPHGHGLGLVLSHEIVRRIGGTIQLGNLTPRGALFTLCYPLEQGKAGDSGQMASADTVDRGPDPYGSSPSR